MNATLLGLVLVLPGAAPAPGEWKYVVPPAGDPFAHPAPRAVPLSDRAPPGLKEDVRYRGHRRRYGQLVYGRGRTAPVPVVVDLRAGGKVDLYIDSRRYGKITAASRVPGDGPLYRVPLNAVVHAGDEVQELPRTAVLRYLPVTGTLAAATCGYVEGTVLLDGRPVKARRVDADLNGLFADPQDRVWLDLNRDGRWGADEEFLFLPILSVGGKRIRLRADALGRRLALAPAEGDGAVKLQLPAGLKKDAVRELQVTVQSRDGVVASLRGPEAAITLPVGEYRISGVVLVVADPTKGPAWGYVFNDEGDTRAARWHRLGKGGTLTLDPVGKMRFQVGLEDGKKACAPGEPLSVAPRLYTQDGLLIERAYRGQVDDRGGGCAGAVQLLGPGGAQLDSARSGFA